MFNLFRYVFIGYFYLLSFISTLWMCMVCLPLLISKKASMWFIRSWATVELFFLKIFCGLSYKLVGFNVSDSGNIIACKHQSAFEILILLKHVKNPVFFLKKELMFVPLVNLYLWRTGQLSVARGSGGNFHLIELAQNRLKDSNVIIFPEGKRVPIAHTDVPYHSGVIFLAHKSNAFIVPFATNTGCFWKRKEFIKRSGVAVLEQLPDFYLENSLKISLQNLQTKINTRSNELCSQET